MPSKTLVVRQGHLGREQEHWNPGTAEDPGTHLRMLFHDSPLGFVQRSCLLQHIVGSADLADVVHGRRAAQHARERRTGTEMQCQGLGQVSDADDVHRRIVIPELRGHAQVEQGLMVRTRHLPERFIAFAVHMPEVLDETLHLLYCLGTEAA